MDRPSRHRALLYKRPQHILPSNKNHNLYLKLLHKYSNENPGEEILSIQAFACHGLMVNGMQVAAANNFNAKEEYYEFI